MQDGYKLEDAELEDMPADRSIAVPVDRRSAYVPADRLVAEELQELYEEQMRRMACPSCGEEAFLG